MNIREITSGIYYTGVNDRVTDKFEGMWPLPYGVSYNAYLVRGSKATALMDTVEITEVHEYLDAVERTLQGAAPDYLVVHHMEPDHSGSIPEVVRRWPDLKIVGNAQTVGMIKGFYHVDDDSRFVPVKDGDTIDLGDMTLLFRLTPMVHWPETMMTYVAERGVLFSGDAFGCFGALNGGLIDTELDTTVYRDEMYRYYSNIVGKYGRFVQQAMQKLSGVTPEYICTTHGPVWHEKIAEVMGIYDRLSRYEGEDGVTIIYGSMYGNTAEVAEEIARGLAEAGVKNIRIHNASHSDMSYMISDAFRYKGLIVGSATYSMTLFPPVKALLTALQVREVKNKVFAGFGSYTWAANVVKKEMEDFCAATGLEMQGFVMMKQGIDEDVRNAARALAAEVAAKLNS